MNSSTIFKTENDSHYLYDANHQQLLNLHPIIKTIHYFHCQANVNDIEKFLGRKYPELSESEIKFYLKKYFFLKTQGFFETFDFERIFTYHITEEKIENQIVHLDCVTFQVTGDCNLNCQYCCYGEMYDDVHRTTQPMDFDTVRTFFEYIIQYWNMNPNHKKIIIGFYGGEPLLNFPLIEKVVSYCKNITSDDLEFTYSITTNAILLDRYANYLVDNDFRILFSLDGDEKGNQLRVDKKKKPSFSRVFSSIKRFQAKYLDFFKEKVDFNAVLNKYTPVEEVNNFIFKEFGKIPSVSHISDVSLNKEKVKEYMQIMQPYIETDELMSLRQDKSSRLKALYGFFYYSLNNSYKHFSDIVHSNKRSQKKIPTGTCLPFYKKMFITADRKIYVCERIGFEYVMGTIDDKVNIDFKEVARKYTFYFSEIAKQCAECYFADMCSECMFQFPSENNIPKCPYQYRKEQYKEYISRIFGILEKRPELFDQINKSVFE